MTTRRNNMFYYRGACSAYAALRGIIEEIKTDEERLAKLEEFRERWLKGSIDYANDQISSEIETETIVTKYYFVHLLLGKLELLKKKFHGHTKEVILWNEKTRTNHVISLCIPPKDLSILFPDIKDIKDPLAKLLGEDPKEMEIVEKPYKIFVMPSDEELK